MSGHNKWSKIKHKKASTDAQKSKVFGKISQLIYLESKKCGGDRESPSLRAVIESAKAVNMPQQNIDRAINKGIGVGAGSLENIVYEGYGPGGCAILVDTLTDNRNRTAAEIRHIFSKYSYSVAAPGAASWNFERGSDSVKVKTFIKLSSKDNKTLEDFVSALKDHSDVQEVYTNNK